MTRRARMLALLQLSTLLFLLMAELTHAAPIPDGITADDGDTVSSEETNDTVVPTVAVKPEDHATTMQGGSSVSEEEVSMHEDPVVTEASNVDRDEDLAGSAEESEEVSEEHKDSSSVKTEDSDRVTASHENKDKPEASQVDSSGEDGNKMEGSGTAVEENVRKHEDTSTKTEEDKTASGATSDAGIVEKHEDPMVTKAEGHKSDTEAKENADKLDRSITNTTAEGINTEEDRDNDLIEDTNKHEATGINNSTNKEQFITATAGVESSEDSNESVDTSQDEGESISPHRGSEENREDEAAEKTALSKEEEVSGKAKNTEGENGMLVTDSSEETSVTENVREDTEMIENESMVHQESHVTSSPFAQLRVPSSDSHHTEQDEQHNDKDAAAEGHESQNPSKEETAESESGSPDELIENDSVDSEVLKNDTHTAALGKAMEIKRPEEDVQNKVESGKTEGLQDTKQDSETFVALNELENTGEERSVEDKDTYNQEEKIESTLSKAPEAVHETESKETVVNSKPLDEKEEQEGKNEKDNLVEEEEDDSLTKGHFEQRNKNEELDVAEETLSISHVTEKTSEEEGSGGVEGMPLFAPSADKDMADTHNHTGSTVREHTDVMLPEEEKTTLPEETAHVIGVFEASGSGHEEEEPEYIGEQENNETDNAEAGTGSGSHPLREHYEEEHTTESNIFSSVPHVPIIDDNEESSAEYYSESPAPETGTSSTTLIFGDADNQSETSDHNLKEESLFENKTNVQVMSINPVPDDDDKGFDGSGDDVTTTPIPDISDEVLANVMKDIIDDNIEVSSKEMDLVNTTSGIGQTSPAFQEKPMEKVISPELESAPHTPSTQPPCVEDADNEDCELQSKKPVEDAGIANILEDDDEVPPETTKAGVLSESSNDDKELEVVISTTPAVKVPSEEESLHQSVAVDLNEPHLHFSEEVSSTTIAAEVQEDREDLENETVVSDGAPDSIVEHPLGEAGVIEMSGKLKIANVNELGVSGQENSEDLGESEALDSSTASGSYVVLGCIMAVVVVLLAYAAIKSRRERATNTSSKKQSEIAGDDDDGTELKDMKKTLLPPETAHDDCNGDIEANRKPLMDRGENPEEDEEKEPIIKQNGTLEPSEPPRDIESQVKSSPAENQLKMAPAPTSNKLQQRNGLSEVVIEKPAISNGKSESIVTHPVSAKVKVIENEDSIAKTPIIINRGSNSPSH